MSERPIIMTALNAQKCHDGRKTQTRRIIKPQPSDDIDNSGDCESIIDMKTGKVIACPYGLVGDRLWVREAWRVSELPSDHGAVFYKGANAADIQAMVKYRPSIHMPRWACRTVLDITEIRVERLNGITVHDCYAEGIRVRGSFARYGVYPESVSHEVLRRMKELWESIRGPGAWGRNDWVWVISFRKV